MTGVYLEREPAFMSYPDFCSWFSEDLSWIPLFELFWYLDLRSMIPELILQLLQIH